MPDQVLDPGALETATQQISPPADQSDDASASTVDTEPTLDPAVQEAAEALAKTMAQKRINELTRGTKEAQREAQEWRNRAIQTGQSIQQLLDQQKTQTQADDTPKPEKYPDYESYLTAKSAHAATQAAQHVVDQRLAQAAQSDQQRQLAQHVQGIQRQALQNITSVKEKYADFDQTMQDGLDAGVNLTDPMTLALSKMGESGGHVSYYLFKNPEAASAIARMPPDEQLLAMGQLRASVSTTGKMVSSAPAPGKPAGARSAPNGSFKNDMTPQEFDAWYDKNFPKGKR